MRRTIELVICSEITFRSSALVWSSGTLESPIPIVIRYQPSCFTLPLLTTYLEWILTGLQVITIHLVAPNNRWMWRLESLVFLTEVAFDRFHFKEHLAPRSTPADRENLSVFIQKYNPPVKPKTHCVRDEKNVHIHLYVKFDEVGTRISCRLITAVENTFNAINLKIMHGTQSHHSRQSGRL